MGSSSPLHRPWAGTWNYHYYPRRMASATPDLRFPSQLVLVPNYYCLMTEAHVCVWTTCPGMHLKAQSNSRHVDRKLNMCWKWQKAVKVKIQCTMGNWHQRPDERHGNSPQGNQELLVVRDKFGRPQVSLG